MTLRHASPKDLRVRARHHMSNYREWWATDPTGARDELDRAQDLNRLAAEAERNGVMG